MLGCTILIVGAAVQTGAKGVAELIAGRIIAGLGNGMNTATIRQYGNTLTSSQFY